MRYTVARSGHSLEGRCCSPPVSSHLGNVLLIETSRPGEELETVAVAG